MGTHKGLRVRLVGGEADSRHCGSALLVSQTGSLMVLMCRWRRRCKRNDNK